MKTIRCLFASVLFAIACVASPAHASTNTSEITDRPSVSLHAAPDRELVVAAVTLSKAMVRTVDAPGTMRATRAG